ncbi:O-methyltransferase [Paenibacillus sp. LHD-117]|uniref:O-methyltransferase n=1 Tax=Paenibacillus sp. LHD-117 TaxID=3071412 RepID=UPI0027E06D57|nr:O-methyltransferase [Paenibacillus sp. LHD-117]MDQ6421835.1 O-methyltransferase [Paenibacillus sp. LHD-117]
MSTNEHYVDGLYEADADLERVKAGIAEAGMPDISIADGYGRLLTLLVRMSGARKVLEIGALGGYSGICLARGIDQQEGGGSLVSLELLQPYADVAARHLAEAGFGGVANFIVGDAKESLVRLKEEGRTFDFFFIDADKEGYPVYLDYALQLAEPGAVIVGDNILLRGRTTDDTKQGPSVQAIRAFNERIARDGRLESTVLPGYDGLAIARVRG